MSVKTLQRNVVTEIGGIVLTANNETSEESLVGLYDITWKVKEGPLQAAHNVFFSQVVDRDVEQVRVPVPERVTTLQWKVDEATPFILETEFTCKGIMIRDEYENMLEAIFRSISEGKGAYFGYSKIAIPKNQCPPYNPFLHLQVQKVQSTKTPGTVVTGTPGIGKSMFLYYVLTLRLIARKTTVLFYDSTHCIIFHENGVFKVKQQEQLDAVGKYLPLDTWFLVDSNEEVATPPFQIIKWCRTTPRVILVAASPRSQRSTFSKDPMISILWMEPFSLKEYIMARKVQIALAPAAEKLLEEFYDLFGPVAREAFHYTGNAGAYAQVIRCVLGSSSLDDFQKAATQASEGYFEKEVLSRKVLNAFPLNDLRDEFYVRIPTKTLADLVVESLMLHTERQARRICSLFLLSNRTRSVAGRLLESLALAAIPRGGQWSMLPMKKKPLTSRSVNQHWAADPGGRPHVLRTGYRGKFLEILEGSLEVLLSDDFTRSDSIPFVKGTEPELNKGFYIPVAQNFPTFDAYAYDGTTGHMVIFQMTCSDTHSLSSTGLDWLGVQSVDVIVVTTYDGGYNVHTPLPYAGKLRNAYRLVLFPDPNVSNATII